MKGGKIRRNICLRKRKLYEFIEMMLPEQSNSKEKSLNACYGEVSAGP